jgi:hypothetical protein
MRSGALRLCVGLPGLAWRACDGEQVVGAISAPLFLASHLPARPGAGGCG